MLKRSTSAPSTRRKSNSPRAGSGAIDRRSFLRSSGVVGLSLGSIGTFAGMVQKADAAVDIGTDIFVRRKTICQFCSVGCSLWAEVKNGVWIGQEPAFESPINQGTHCAKGAAMREIAIGERRLKYPMKKTAGEWQRITWDQAIAEIGDKLAAIREKDGPDSVYWLGSAKYSNEQSYLMRKFAALWGTNNVDHQARICHSTTVAGVANTFGYGAMTNTFNDIRNSKLIFLIGGNPAEAHPVSMLHLLAAKENGAKLIVVDPRFTRTAAHADDYVRIRPGADIGFMWGIVREIFENEWEDTEYMKQRVFGLEDVRKEVEKWTPEEVERVSGIPPEQTRKIARMMAEHRPGTVIWCMGLTQSSVGSSKTRAASILQLVLGNIGVSGGGTNIFRGHDNVQGATDLGVSCDSLPAYYGLSEGAWKHWARVWDLDFEWVKSRFESKELMEAEGIPVSRYLDGILEDPENIDQPNPLKAMIFWGHAANSITRGPDQREALDRVDLLCVIDPHPTQVAIMTDKTDDVYLLPAATTAEADGSVTNSSRSLQWREKVVEPLFESKTDYEITYLLARKLGFDSELFKHIEIREGVPLAEDILREVNKGAWTIGYTGQSPERLKLHMQHQDKFDSITLKGKEEPVLGDYYCLPWPAWGRSVDEHPGTPLLYDVSKPVAEGGLPFRARWGVEHEGANLLAENSWTEKSEIKDGYPEGTFGMISALGWTDELTSREKLTVLAVGMDRFRFDMFDIEENEAKQVLQTLAEEARRMRRTDHNSVQESWGGAGNEPKGADQPEPLTSHFPDYPENALKEIDAYLAANPQDDATSDLSMAQKVSRVNWKTDLSGGIQRVMISHGLAPYGNGKARAKVWNFPDAVPRHREPLYTPRRDLLPEYETYEDQKKWRLPTLYRSIQEKDWSSEYPMVLTSGRLVEFEGGGDETRSNKWLAEFQQEMFAEIHPEDAVAAGITNGTFCWVRSPEGRIRVKALVTRRVGPGTVFMPFHFAGMWMGEDLSYRYPKGAAPFVIGEAANTIQTYGYDIVTQMQETKATLCRIEPAQKE